MLIIDNNVATVDAAASDTIPLPPSPIDDMPHCPGAGKVQIVNQPEMINDSYLQPANCLATNSNYLPIITGVNELSVLEDNIGLHHEMQSNKDGIHCNEQALDDGITYSVKRQHLLLILKI